MKRSARPRRSASRPRAARPLAGALAGLLLLAATGGRAAARSLAIERFDAEVVVARDATIEVTETIRARFTGAWNGLYRTIPVAYRTPQGFGYRLILRPRGVTDGAGRPLRFQAGSERHYRKFEKFLPFAMALGVEQKWARAFEGICQKPPDWYRGTSVSDFRPRLFVDRLGGMSRSAAAVMVSQPRSAGGSGFGGGGGGGFSGGGFGGGGGGGF